MVHYSLPKTMEGFSQVPPASALLHHLHSCNHGVNKPSAN